MCYINLPRGKIVCKFHRIEGDIAFELAGFNIYMYTFFESTTC